MKIIQEMIQIERPVNWTQEKIVKIAKEIMGIEIYNAKTQNRYETVKSIWNTIPNGLIN
jgi:hypothetical protein